MQASLEEVYIAPDTEVSEEESETFKYLIGWYSENVNNSKQAEDFESSTINECLYATAHWLSLLEPLKSTHYFLAEAMEEREDASDLVIHSSEIQQACKSVLAQMFLIACNIYRFEENLETHTDLLNHMVSIMNTKLEEAGATADAVQLELFN